jgi:hypothetical protein
MDKGNLVPDDVRSSMLTHTHAAGMRALTD